MIPKLSFQIPKSYFNKVIFLFNFIIQWIRYSYLIQVVTLLFLINYLL